MDSSNLSSLIRIDPPSENILFAPKSRYRISLPEQNLQIINAKTILDKKPLEKDENHDENRAKILSDDDIKSDADIDEDELNATLNGLFMTRPSYVSDAKGPNQLRYCWKISVKT